MLGNKQGNILLGFLLNFSLPSAIFKGVYHSQISIDLLLTLLNALCCSLLGGVLMFVLTYKILRRSREIAIVMSFLVVLHNTLFLGVPMVYGAIGEEAAHKAILFDQFCTSIPLAILTPIIMSLSGKGSFRIKAVGMRLFQNPLFLAMITGFILKAMPFKIPEDFFTPINALAACATPVALFAIGVQLSFRDVKIEWKNSLLVLVFAMMLVPAMFLASLHGLGIEINDNHRMALIEVSMPPLISSAAIIARAGLNQKIAVACIVIGIFLSAATTPIWRYLGYL